MLYKIQNQHLGMRVSHDISFECLSFGGYFVSKAGWKTDFFFNPTKKRKGFKIHTVPNSDKNHLLWYLFEIEFKEKICPDNCFFGEIYIYIYLLLKIWE